MNIIIEFHAHTYFHTVEVETLDEMYDKFAELEKNGAEIETVYIFGKYYPYNLVPLKGGD